MFQRDIMHKETKFKKEIVNTMDWPKGKLIIPNIKIWFHYIYDKYIYPKPNVS